MITGVEGDSAARGPCCSSAAETPIEGRRRISHSFSAISRTGPSAGPRPATKTADALARSSATLDHSIASAWLNRPGRRSSAPLSGPSSAHSATSAAPAAIEPITVLVAATECSRPASMGMTNSALSATGEAAALTIATVRAPASRAARVAATRSGLRPDCEITMNSALRSLSGTRKAVMTEGAPADTGSRSRVSTRYLRKTPACPELPRPQITHSGAAPTARRAAISRVAARARMILATTSALSPISLAIADVVTAARLRPACAAPRLCR